jgi:hypothetical protein
MVFDRVTYVDAYGGKWTGSRPDALQVEFRQITLAWREHLAGKPCVERLLKHYLRARKLVWPDRYCHRWTELLYRNFIEHNVVVAIGPASSGKTATASEFNLLDYWLYPNETAVIVSSTTRQKLEDAVWAEIKKLWKAGRARFPWLAGHMIDYRQRIATDEINPDSDEARDLRKGIFCVATYTGRSFSGLGVFAGIKQKRLRLQADECQFMVPTFLDCLPNLRSNTGAGGFRLITSGNPKHDPNDQLGLIAEPLEGWQSVDGIEKTTIWPIKMLGGVCINLVGMDSPNFDQDKDIYTGLIGHDFEKIIVHDYGRGSPTWETQFAGRMRIGLEHSRVITRQICRLHHAHEPAVWDARPRTRIYAVDPAYGGGDRCVAGWAEFGEGIEGRQIIRINRPRILKIVVSTQETPEDQIARMVKEELDNYQIPPENCFYDSFGKGTVGYAFARVFGSNSPVPVDAGARPTTRPVRYDLFITETNGTRRLKRCNEHYSKFITELWFSVRETIESDQMRELPEDVMLEGCWREYQTVSGNLIEVESKDDLKERMGRSPDLFDYAAILIEGARQRGFKIRRLGTDVVTSSSAWDWFFKEQAQSAEQRKKHALTF